ALSGWIKRVWPEPACRVEHEVRGPGFHAACKMPGPPTATRFFGYRDPGARRGPDLHPPAGPHRRERRPAVRHRAFAAAGRVDRLDPRHRAVARAGAVARTAAATAARR